MSALTLRDAIKAQLDLEIGPAPTGFDASRTSIAQAFADAIYADSNLVNSGSAPAAATATALGTVKISGAPTDPANPTVYVKEQADTLLAAKLPTAGGTLSGALAIQTAAAGNWALKLQLAGEANPRLGVENGGALKWSDGTTIDTSLSRTAASELTAGVNTFKLTGNQRIGNAAASAEAPTKYLSIGSTTLTDKVGIDLYVNDGTQNTRVQMYLDASGKTFVHKHGYSNSGDIAYSYANGRLVVAAGGGPISINVPLQWNRTTYGWDDYLRFSDGTNIIRIGLGSTAGNMVFRATGYQLYKGDGSSVNLSIADSGALTVNGPVTVTGTVSAFKLTGVADASAPSVLDLYASASAVPATYTRLGGFYTDYAAGAPSFFGVFTTGTLPLRLNSAGGVVIPQAGLTVSAGTVTLPFATLSAVSTFGVVKTPANVGILIQSSTIATSGPVGGGLNLIGGGFGGQASRAGMWAGATNDLGTYTARATTAAGINFIDGVTNIYANTGLTAGSTFTPTVVASVSSTGLAVTGSLTVNGAAVASASSLNNYLPLTGGTLVGATGDIFTIHDNASGGSLIFRSDGTGQTRITFGSAGYIAGAAGKVNISSADATKYVSLQINGVEKAWLRTDGIFDFNSGAWEKVRLETGTTGLVRLGSDSNGLNFTTNAVWNGTAWTRDDTTKASFALIQHLGNSDYEFRVAAAAAGNISWLTPLAITATGNLNISTSSYMLWGSTFRIYIGGEDGTTSFNTIRASTSNLILNAMTGGGIYLNYGHGNIVNFGNGSQGVVATVDSTGLGTFNGGVNLKDSTLGIIKSSVVATPLFTVGISGANGLQIKRASTSADTKLYWLSNGNVANASVDFESGDALFHTVNATSAWLRDPNQTTGQDVPLQIGRMADVNSPFSQIQINDATDDLFMIRVNRWGHKFRLVSADSTASEKINMEVYGADGGATYLKLYDRPTGSTNPVNVVIQTQGQSYLTGTGVQLGIGLTANTSGYMLDVNGSVRVNGQLYLAANGQGIKFTDDGDFADLNDAYLSLRFTNGVQIYSGNSSGSVAITLGSNGKATFWGAGGQLKLSGNPNFSGGLWTSASASDNNLYLAEWNTGKGLRVDMSSGDVSVIGNGNITMNPSSAIGYFRNENPGVSPISRRLAFGTDNSGWQMRFAKNVSGVFTDLVYISDSGNMGIGRPSTAETGNPMLFIHGGTGAASSGRTGVLQVDATNRDLNIGSWSRVKIYTNVGDQAAPTTGVLVLTASTDGSATFSGAVSASGILTVTKAGGSPVVINRNDDATATRGIIAGQRAGGTKWLLGVDTTDKFAIMDSGGTVRLTVDPANGNLVAGGDVTAFSDARLKRNVRTVSRALEIVKQLRGVAFERIDTKRDSFGLIAQEVERVVPEVVHTNAEGVKSVAYGNLVGILVEAVKQLAQLVEGH